MSLQKISSYTRGKKVVSLLCALVLTACATHGPIASDNSDFNGSTADAINSHDYKSSDSDAELFSDVIENGKEDFKPATISSVVESGVSGSTTDEGTPYYKAAGGENLTSVAYTLYGSKSVDILLRLNPQLKGKRTLAADERVNFEFDNLKPAPGFLSKDLIDRYKDQLAAKIANNDGSIESTVVGAGDTLQKVSQRLYGTTRFWTELYLLNQDKLSGYDKLKNGAQLSYVKRTTDQVLAGIRKSSLPDAVAVEAERAAPAESHTAAEMTTQQQEEPIPTEVAPPTQASEPSQEAAAAPVMAQTENARGMIPPVLAPEKKSEPVAEVMSVDSGTTNNTRRIVYVGMILAIAMGAFYMTRPSKRQRNFEMMDISPDQGVSSRQKLHEEHTDKRDIG